MFLLSFSYRKPEPMPRLTTPTDMTKLTPDDNPYNHPSGHILHAYFMAHVDILGTMPMTVRALDEPGLFDVEVNGMTCRSILTVAVDQGADDIDFDIVSFVVSDIFMCDVTFSYDHNQPHAGMFRIMTSMLEEVFMVRRTAITEALRQHLTMNAQTSPAPGATSPTTDHTSMYQTEIDAAEAQLIATRAVLLADLRVLGVARVEMYYEGYEDSGNVDFINFTPSNVMIAESLNHRVEDFGWDFAYSCNPGFENACGGGGTLYWNLETDSISIEHSDFGEEAEPTLYEGL